MKASAPGAPSAIPTRLLRRTAVSALLCLAAGGAKAVEAEAQVYECRQGGQITFSDQPCAGQERKIEVPYDRPSQAEVREAQSEAQAEEADANVQFQQIQAQEAEAQAEQAEAQSEPPQDPGPASDSDGVLYGGEALSPGELDGAILAAQTRLRELEAERAARLGEIAHRREAIGEGPNRAADLDQIDGEAVEIQREYDRRIDEAGAQLNDLHARRAERSGLR